MYIVAIAWGFVVVLMAAAEATASEGSLLGAFFTLLLYGVLPLSIVLYVMGTPARRRARLQAEQAATQAAQPFQPQSASDPPDGRSMAARDGVAPERKEP